MRDHRLTDAHAPLLLEVLLRDEDGYEDVVIPAYQFVRGLTVRETAIGAWSGVLTLFDSEGDFLETLLAQVRPDSRVVRFRWGWEHGVGLEGAPWYAGKVAKWDTNFTELGTELTLEITSPVVIDHVADKFDYSVPQGRNPSDVLQEIAALHGWSTGDVRGLSTVERAASPLPIELQSINESILSFINRLLPYSRNSAGEPFQFFISRGNVVHFHSRSFAAHNSGIVRSYTFARDAHGEVRSFAPENTTLFSQLGGSSEARYTFVEERTGRRVVIETTKDGGPDSLIVSYPDEQAVTSYGDGVKALIPIPARTEEEGRLLVNNNYQRKRQEPYGARIEVRGTHDIEPMDHIAVRYITRRGATHYLSGVFQVFEMEHTVEPGSWSTSMRLQRGGQGELVPDKDERVRVDRHVTLAEDVAAYQAATSAKQKKDIKLQRRAVRPSERRAAGSSDQ